MNSQPLFIFCFFLVLKQIYKLEKNFIVLIKFVQWKKIYNTKKYNESLLILLKIQTNQK